MSGQVKPPVGDVEFIYWFKNHKLWYDQQNHYHMNNNGAEIYLAEMLVARLPSVGEV